MRLWTKIGALGFLALVLFLVYQVPWIKHQLDWRVDFGLTYLRGMVQPVAGLPSPLPQPAVAITNHPDTPTAINPQLQNTTTSSLPTTSPAPLPTRVSLPAPAHEKQDINNCGPAALTMYLRFWGWEGDQFEISDLLKPQRDDRNVNVEELAYFVRTRAGWLNIEYRVGGDLRLLKSLLAAGIPVMIEESFFFDDPFWPNDDLWAAHYNLLTGYDDAARTFTSQDSYRGANQQVDYQNLDEYWQVFNRVYILVYPPDMQDTVQSLLGADLDATTNRQYALDTSLAETQADPENAFAWFNLGSNYVYFENYPEAALAYDQARKIGLPQRMLRYQFGPFFAYFHTSRLEDLMALTKYALQRTPNSEEALLWRGWGYYRQGKIKEAIADFEAALEQNPNYSDAQYALDFVTNNQ